MDIVFFITVSLALTIFRVSLLSRQYDFTMIFIDFQRLRRIYTVHPVLSFYPVPSGIVIITTVPPPSRGQMVRLPPHIISSLCWMFSSVV